MAKKGICLDPQNLNKALKREYYQLPTFEKITRDIAGCGFFTILDANKGFWQSELEEESADLTTFATPFGRFKFKRLPFGISTAPEIFHRTFAEIFRDIKGIKVYIDDLLIYAKTEQEHNRILKEVLRKAEQTGIKCNKNKCK